MSSCTKLNNEGTEAIKDGHHELALTKFTKALLFAKSNDQKSLILSNRSATSLKIKQYETAISDARECVRLCPIWSKGYLRWGQALEASGRYSQMCNIYISAIMRREGHEKLLLEHLIEANKRHNILTQDFMDMVVLGDSSYCEVCRETKELIACPHCNVLYYCSLSHQELNAQEHQTQCSDLAEAHNFLIEERNLDINKEKSWLELRQPFETLVGSWDQVWMYLKCAACASDVFRRRMGESMSWALNVLHTIHRLGLAKKDSLVIHILGADDTYFKEGYFTYFPGFLPFPFVHFVLIGPDILHKTAPVEYTNFCGNQIRLSHISDTWHNYVKEDKHSLPDLVYAAHPGIQEVFYEWEPTIELLINSHIPTVFTTWHEEDFLVTMNLLNDKYGAGVFFEGSTPFPSLVKRYARKRWNKYGIQRMNSFWVGFQGRATGQL